MISFLFRRKISAPLTEQPLPLRLWYRDEHSRTQLRQILKAPGFLKAVATLRELALPTSSTVTVPADQAARREAWLAGYCDFLRDLEKLAAEVPQQHQEPEWSYITNPQEPSYRE